MLRPVSVSLVLAGVLACGDNSKTCGNGTDDSDGDGECEAAIPMGDDVCGDGTRLDPITMTCLPDATACSGGTVLVNNRCQDPAAGLDIDLEEGPEPNAFEPGAVPAGVITLAPPGGNGFVLHGCVRPLDDVTPDYDAYTLSVAAPTLVRVTADGVLGLSAAFVVTSSEPVLAGWKRYGLAGATDLARRQVWLPGAGTYRFVVTDTRTILPEALGLTTAPPAGNPDGTSCYYVTIEQLVPMPATLDLAVGDTGTLGEEIKLYSTTVPAGTVQLTWEITTPHARPAIVVSKNGALHAYDQDGTLTMSGFTTGDTALIAADHVFNYAVFPAPYRLTSP